MKTRFCFLFSFSLLFLNISVFCDNRNNNRLKDVLQSNNRSSNSNNSDNNSNNQNDEDENVLKKEARKLLKECGVDVNVSDEDNDNTYHSSNRNKNYNSNRNRKNNYRDKFNTNNNDDSSSSSSEFSSSGGYGNNNRNGENGDWNAYSTNRNNNNRYNGYNSGYDNRNSNRNSGTYGSSQPSQYGQSSNRYNDRNSYGSYHYEPNFDDSLPSTPAHGFNRINNCRDSGSSNNFGGGYGFNRNGYGLNDRGRYDGFGGVRYSGGLTQLQNSRRSSLNNDRSRRYNSNGNNYYNRQNNNNNNGNDNDENQCVSQCVFGYLQVLDDDRTPSETLLIKWLQEHNQSDDMKRIKALREARRCFGRLTTSDIEDGCDFSEELAKCLELNME